MLAPSVVKTQHSSHPCAQARTPSDFLIHNAGSRFSDLPNPSFFLERRQISCCCGVRDMQELLDFVVGYLSLRVQCLHYLVSFLSLAVLYCDTGAGEEVADVGGWD
jgi:hypothetical protein